MNYYLYLDDLKLIKTYLKIFEFTPFNIIYKSNHMIYLLIFV